MSETKDRESSKNKDNNTLDKDNKKRKRDESESDESEEDIPTRKKRITMTDCRKVFERMMEHEKAWPFMEPLDTNEEIFKDFKNLVKRTMNFRRIKEKLDQRKYMDSERFVEDMNLIWKGIFVYNKKKSPIYQFALELQQEFNHRIQLLEKGDVRGTMVLVKKKKSRKRESDVCGTCGECGELLICDGDCCRAFHLECVGLSTEPDTDKWFCEDCEKKEKQKTKKLANMFAKKSKLDPAQMVAKRARIEAEKAAALASIPAISTLDVTSVSMLPNFGNQIPPPNNQVVMWFQNFRSKYSVPLPGEITDVFPSQILDKEIADYKADTSISHLQKGEDFQKKSLKVLRRMIEESLKTAYMYYDPILCVWKPKSKGDFIDAVNTLYAQALSQPNVKTQQIEETVETGSVV